MNERAFASIPVNLRSQGLTEIRGPYYTPMGRRYLKDIRETMHPYRADAVDSSSGKHKRSAST